RVELLGTGEHLRTVAPPAQSGVVLEAHPHVVGGARGGRGDTSDEQAGEEQARAQTHWQGLLPFWARKVGLRSSRNLADRFHPFGRFLHTFYSATNSCRR